MDNVIVLLIEQSYQYAIPHTKQSLFFVKRVPKYIEQIIIEGRIPPFAAFSNNSFEREEVLLLVLLLLFSGSYDP
jgi:hypothetical protein